MTKRKRTAKRDYSLTWTGEMTIDADGCPHAYGPPGTDPLDYLPNAGYNGNWWGIVTTENGRPFLQKEGDEERWPWPGYYISTTAYLVPEFGKYDCRHYLDSEFVLFLVVPGVFKQRARKRVLGCRGMVTNLKTSKKVECVCGDVGPSRHYGEASMALAKAFRVNPDPKRGGSEEKIWHYEIWPGEPAEGYILQ